jgi:hypothetical protein
MRDVGLADSLMGRLTVEGTRYRATYSTRAFSNPQSSLHVEAMTLDWEDMGAAGQPKEDLGKLIGVAIEGHRLIAGFLGMA